MKKKTGVKIEIVWMLIILFSVVLNCYLIETKVSLIVCDNSVIMKEDIGLQVGEIVYKDGGDIEYALYKDRTTGSMYPFIRDGTMIYSIDITNETVLSPPDVVIYKRADGSKYIQHRIMDVVTINNQTYYLTKGDANTLADNHLVLREQILRKVVGVRYE